MVSCNSRGISFSNGYVDDCRQVQPARTSTVSQASPVEVVQLANEAAFIGGVAGTMISMTLIVRRYTYSSLLFRGVHDL